MFFVSSMEILILCCAIKPTIAWFANRVGNSCRERCGGQGYLSVNRLGDVIGFAHAGMTAEGDNIVLYQKVCKELLALFQKNKLKFPNYVKSNKNNGGINVNDINLTNPNHLLKIQMLFQ